MEACIDMLADQGGAMGTFVLYCGMDLLPLQGRALSYQYLQYLSDIPSESRMVGCVRRCLAYFLGEGRPLLRKAAPGSGLWGADGAKKALGGVERT